MKKIKLTSLLLFLTTLIYGQFPVNQKISFNKEVNFHGLTLVKDVPLYFYNGSHYTSLQLRNDSLIMDPIYPTNFSSSSGSGTNYFSTIGTWIYPTNKRYHFYHVTGTGYLPPDNDTTYFQGTPDFIFISSDTNTTTRIHHGVSETYIGGSMFRTTSIQNSLNATILNEANLISLNAQSNNGNSSLLVQDQYIAFSSPNITRNNDGFSKDDLMRRSQYGNVYKNGDTLYHLGALNGWNSILPVASFLSTGMPIVDPPYKGDTYIIDILGYIRTISFAEEFKIQINNIDIATTIPFDYGFSNSIDSLPLSIHAEVIFTDTIAGAEVVHVLGYVLSQKGFNYLTENTQPLFVYFTPFLNTQSLGTENGNFSFNVLRQCNNGAGDNTSGQDFTIISARIKRETF